MQNNKQAKQKFLHRSFSNLEFILIIGQAIKKYKKVTSASAQDADVWLNM